MCSQAGQTAGEVAHLAAPNGLKAQYARPNVYYPDVPAGLSCLFRPGASLDELAHKGSYRNPKLSVAIVQHLVRELATVGCELVLFVTPVTGYPDHHTLVVACGGMLEPTLRYVALGALIRAMIVVDNPYSAAAAVTHAVQRYAPVEERGHDYAHD